MTMIGTMETAGLHVESLRHDLARFRDVLDSTDAALGMSEQVLEAAERVAESSRRWLPRVALIAAGVVVIGVGVVIIQRLRHSDGIAEGVVESAADSPASA